MISRIQIQNFRSVRKIDLELGRLNVVVGSNGCGKSNIYKGIQLLSAVAEGRCSSHLSDEGGLENVMWSGQCNASAGLYRTRVRHAAKLPLAGQYPRT